jgi:hypothetical protein
VAEPYLADVLDLADQWMTADPALGPLECRHFFSGAAVYRAGEIVASLTPVGLAFKVSPAVHDDLLSSGEVVPLRYFPNAPIKKDYVLFPEVASVDAATAARLIMARS